MSSHEPLQSHRPATQGSNRNFGLVFAAVFLIVAVWPWLSRGEAFRFWVLGLSLVFLYLAVFAQGRLARLNRLWFKLGVALHAIFSPLLMGLLFYGAVTPVGYIMRIFGHDLLSLRRSDRPSYWIRRDAAASTKSSMKHQF